MDAPLQRPLWPISIILNFPKNFLVKADIKQLSPKVLMKIEGIQAIFVLDGLNQPPPPSLTFLMQFIF
jgi:hypothetical protein